MTTGQPHACDVLLTADAVGGVWNYSLALAHGFAAGGRATTLAVMGPSPSAVQLAAANSIPGLSIVDTHLPLEWMAPDTAALGAAVRALAALARCSGARTVHLHTPALAAFHWPVPVVAVAHSCVATWWDAVQGGPMPADLAWTAALMSEGLRRAHAVIAPSHSFAESLRNRYAPGRPIHVVLNGVEVTCPAGVARERCVLTVGRLWDEGKNAATLDLAAARMSAPVRAAGPLAGPNGARFAPAHMIALGTLGGGDLCHSYAQAGIFASAARYEPFGLAIVEAAQTGAPLVLSDIPTHRELWTGAAHFVAAADAAAWADTLEALLDDHATLAAMGARARQRATAFSPRRMVSETAAIHRALRAPLAATA